MNPAQVASRSDVARRQSPRGPLRRLLLSLTAAAFGSAALVASAAAQFARVVALPPSDVFSLRVTGDTIVAGTDTSVFISTNGGVAWRASARPSPEAKTIDAVLLRHHRLFAGTFGLGVFVSDDLGASWRPFNEGLVGGILDSQLDVSDLETRGDSLVASTEGAGVFVRNLAVTDTWHPFGNVFEPNQAANVNDLATDGTRLLACAGDNGTLFRRDPGEPDWTLTLIGNIALRPGLTGLAAFFTGTRWVVGTNSGVFLSAKGQEPWSASQTRIPASHGMAFAQVGSDLFGVFDVLMDFLLEESHDGGTTWTVTEQVNNSFAYQLAIHGSDLFAARSDGLFVRSLAVASVPTPPGSGSLHLSLVGPQPIRGAARFRFELPAAAETRLELFDLAGRRVAASAATLPAGTNELELDARELPPGIYAVALTSGSAHATARVVRVR